MLYRNLICEFVIFSSISQIIQGDQFGWEWPAVYQQVNHQPSYHSFNDPVHTSLYQNVLAHPFQNILVHPTQNVIARPVQNTQVNSFANLDPRRIPSSYGHHLPQPSAFVNNRPTQRTRKRPNPNQTVVGNNVIQNNHDTRHTVHAKVANIKSRIGVQHNNSSLSRQHEKERKQQRNDLQLMSKASTQRSIENMLGQSQHQKDGFGAHNLDKIGLQNLNKLHRVKQKKNNHVHMFSENSFENVGKSQLNNQIIRLLQDLNQNSSNIGTPESALRRVLIQSKNDILSSLAGNKNDSFSNILLSWESEHIPNSSRSNETTASDRTHPHTIKQTIVFAKTANILSTVGSQHNDKSSSVLVNNGTIHKAVDIKLKNITKNPGVEKNGNQSKTGNISLPTTNNVSSHGAYISDGLKHKFRKKMGNLMSKEHQNPQTINEKVVKQKKNKTITKLENKIMKEKKGNVQTQPNRDMLAKSQKEEPTRKVAKLKNINKTFSNSRDGYGKNKRRSGNMKRKEDLTKFKSKLKQRFIRNDVKKKIIENTKERTLKKQQRKQIQENKRETQPKSKTYAIQSHTDQSQTRNRQVNSTVSFPKTNRTVLKTDIKQPYLISTSKQNITSVKQPESNKPALSEFAFNSENHARMTEIRNSVNKANIPRTRSFMSPIETRKRVKEINRRSGLTEKDVIKLLNKIPKSRFVKKKTNTSLTKAKNSIVNRKKGRVQTKTNWKKTAKSPRKVANRKLANLKNYKNFSKLKNGNGESTKLNEHIKKKEDLTKQGSKLKQQFVRNDVKNEISKMKKERTAKKQQRKHIKGNRKEIQPKSKKHMMQNHTGRRQLRNKHVNGTFSKANRTVMNRDIQQPYLISTSKQNITAVKQPESNKPALSEFAFNSENHALMTEIGSNAKKSDNVSKINSFKSQISTGKNLNELNRRPRLTESDIIRILDSIPKSPFVKRESNVQTQTNRKKPVKSQRKVTNRKLAKLKAKDLKQSKLKNGIGKNARRSGNIKKKEHFTMLKSKLKKQFVRNNVRNKISERKRERTEKTQQKKQRQVKKTKIQPTFRKDTIQIHKGKSQIQNKQANNTETFSKTVRNINIKKQNLISKAQKKITTLKQMNKSSLSEFAFNSENHTLKKEIGSGVKNAMNVSRVTSFVSPIVTRKGLNDLKRRSRLTESDVIKLLDSIPKSKFVKKKSKTTLTKSTANGKKGNVQTQTNRNKPVKSQRNETNRKLAKLKAKDKTFLKFKNGDGKTIRRSENIKREEHLTKLKSNFKRQFVRNKNKIFKMKKERTAKKEKKKRMVEIQPKSRTNIKQSNNSKSQIQKEHVNNTLTFLKTNRGVMNIDIKKPKVSSTAKQNITAVKQLLSDKPALSEFAFNFENHTFITKIGSNIKKANDASPTTALVSPLVKVIGLNDFNRSSGITDNDVNLSGSVSKSPVTGNHYMMAQTELTPNHVDPLNKNLENEVQKGNSIPNTVKIKNQNQLKRSQKIEVKNINFHTPNMQPVNSKFDSVDLSLRQKHPTQVSKRFLSAGPRIEEVLKHSDFGNKVISTLSSLPAELSMKTTTSVPVSVQNAIHELWSPYGLGDKARETSFTPSIELVNNNHASPERINNESNRINKLAEGGTNSSKQSKSTQSELGTSHSSFSPTNSLHSALNLHSVLPQMMQNIDKQSLWDIASIKLQNQSSNMEQQISQLKKWMGLQASSALNNISDAKSGTTLSSQDIQKQMQTHINITKNKTKIPQPKFLEFIHPLAETTTVQVMPATVETRTTKLSDWSKLPESVTNELKPTKNPFNTSTSVTFLSKNRSDQRAVGRKVGQNDGQTNSVLPLDGNTYTSHHRNAPEDLSSNGNILGTSFMTGKRKKEITLSKIFLKSPDSRNTKNLAKPKWKEIAPSPIQIPVLSNQMSKVQYVPSPNLNDAINKNLKTFAKQSDLQITKNPAKPKWTKISPSRIQTPVSSNQISSSQLVSIDNATSPYLNDVMNLDSRTIEKSSDLQNTHNTTQPKWKEINLPRNHIPVSPNQISSVQWVPIDNAPSSHLNGNMNQDSRTFQNSSALHVTENTPTTKWKEINLPRIERPQSSNQISKDQWVSVYNMQSPGLNNAINQDSKTFATRFNLQNTKHSTSRWKEIIPPLIKTSVSPNQTSNIQWVSIDNVSSHDAMTQDPKTFATQSDLQNTASPKWKEIIPPLVSIPVSSNQGSNNQLVSIDNVSSSNNTRGQGAGLTNIINKGKKAIGAFKRRHNGIHDVQNGHTHSSPAVKQTISNLSSRSSLHTSLSDATTNTTPVVPATNLIQKNVSTIGIDVKSFIRPYHKFNSVSTVHNINGINVQSSINPRTEHNNDNFKNRNIHHKSAPKGINPINTQNNAIISSTRATQIAVDVNSGPNLSHLYSNDGNVPFLMVSHHTKSSHADVNLGNSVSHRNNRNRHQHGVNILVDTSSDFVQDSKNAVSNVNVIKEDAKSNGFPINNDMATQLQAKNSNFVSDSHPSFAVGHSGDQKMKSDSGNITTFQSVDKTTTPNLRSNIIATNVKLRPQTLPNKRTINNKIQQSPSDPLNIAFIKSNNGKRKKIKTKHMKNANPSSFSKVIKPTNTPASKTLDKGNGMTTVPAKTPKNLTLVEKNPKQVDLSFGINGGVSIKTNSNKSGMAAFTYTRKEHELPKANSIKDVARNRNSNKGVQTFADTDSKVPKNSLTISNYNISPSDETSSKVHDIFKIQSFLRSSNGNGKHINTFNEVSFNSKDIHPQINSNAVADTDRTKHNMTNVSSTRGAQRVMASKDKRTRQRGFKQITTTDGNITHNKKSFPYLNFNNIKPHARKGTENISTDKNSENGFSNVKIDKSLKEQYVDAHSNQRVQSQLKDNENINNWEKQTSTRKNTKTSNSTLRKGSFESVPNTNINSIDAFGKRSNSLIAENTKNSQKAIWIPVSHINPKPNNVWVTLPVKNKLLFNRENSSMTEHSSSTSRQNKANNEQQNTKHIFSNNRTPQQYNNQRLPWQPQILPVTNRNLYMNYFRSSQSNSGGFPNQYVIDQTSGLNSWNIQNQIINSRNMFNTLPSNQWMNYHNFLLNKQNRKSIYSKKRQEPWQKTLNGNNIQVLPKQRSWIPRWPVLLNNDFEIDDILGGFET